MNYRKKTIISTLDFQIWHYKECEWVIYISYCKRTILFEIVPRNSLELVEK